MTATQFVAALVLLVLALANAVLDLAPASPASPAARTWAERRTEPTNLTSERVDLSPYPGEEQVDPGAEIDHVVLAVDQRRRRFEQ